MDKTKILHRTYTTSLQTRMTTLIKVKLKNSDKQTSIDKYRVDQMYIKKCKDICVTMQNLIPSNFIILAMQSDIRNRPTDRPNSGA